MEALRPARRQRHPVDGVGLRADPAVAPLNEAVPSGPWLTVLGMHRSGTSAVAGALANLGLEGPGADDRMDWPESNPEHWESLSLTVFDDKLLDALGGSWDAPPELPVNWGATPGRWPCRPGGSA